MTSGSPGLDSQRGWKLWTLSTKPVSRLGSGASVVAVGTITSGREASFSFTCDSMTCVKRGKQHLEGVGHLLAPPVQGSLYVVLDVLLSQLFLSETKNYEK